MFHAFRSLLAVSFHINFGLPLGRFPSIFISTTARMFSVSFLLLTCPKNSSLLLLITIAIGSTFASSTISLFLRCSNRLTHIAHSTSLVSVVATCCCHARSFNFVGIFLSQITPLSSLHFDHAFATLLFTSLLAPPPLSIVDQRYLKDWTVGK